MMKNCFYGNWKKVLKIMIIEHDAFNNKIPIYLCYLLGDCEQCSEGWRAYMYYCVAEGNTPEEICKNWLENVKTLYNVDLSKDVFFGKSDTIFFHGNKFCASKLKTGVYGYPQELNINFTYEKHLD